MTKESITIKIQYPQTVNEIKDRYTEELAKILACKISNNSLDNYMQMIETIYADEISSCDSNTSKGCKSSEWTFTGGLSMDNDKVSPPSVPTERRKK